MAGIYIHIPFCKQACNYCNFHFSTSLRKKKELISAINREIFLQKDYLKGEKIESIYFGGGTPSLLETDEIKYILDNIYNLYEIAPTPEITLEANPDDLTNKKIKELRQSLINRLSIGIQSFFDEDLVFMNRAHNANEAEKSIKYSQDAGFELLTIDLIYGTPTLSNERWSSNIEKSLELEIPHISSYCLTVEPKTMLEKQINKGILQKLNEEQGATQFEILIDTLTANDFEHYEISNFAKPNCHAVHNSNYWLGKKYLGIGPSAHSFDGRNRQHNIANNNLYISSLQQDLLSAEMEELSPEQHYNEYVLTTLRTKWGANKGEILKKGVHFWEHFETNIKPFLQKGQILENNGVFTLSKEGKMIADYITLELFV